MRKVLSHMLGAPSVELDYLRRKKSHQTAMRPEERKDAVSELVNVFRQKLFDFEAML